MYVGLHHILVLLTLTRGQLFDGHIFVSFLQEDKRSELSEQGRPGLPDTLKNDTNPWAKDRLEPFVRMFTGCAISKSFRSE